MQEITLPKNTAGSNAALQSASNNSDSSNTTSNLKTQKTDSSDGVVVNLPNRNISDISQTNPSTPVVSNLSDDDRSTVSLPMFDPSVKDSGSITNQTTGDVDEDQSSTITPQEEVAETQSAQEDPLIQIATPSPSISDQNVSVPATDQPTDKPADQTADLTTPVSPKSTKILPTQQPPAASTPFQNQPFNDPWSDPWGSDTGGGFGGYPTGGSGGMTPPKPQMTPKERVDMIEQVYQNVLKRKPDTRDINYYKYSTLGADEITQQLLDGKEHTQLLENGREFKTLQRRAEEAEMKVKQIESSMSDQLEEYRHLTELLKEKNRLIQELRNQLRNPYNINMPDRYVRTATNIGSNGNNSVSTPPGSTEPGQIEPKKNELGSYTSNEYSYDSSFSDDQRDSHEKDMHREYPISGQYQNSLDQSNIETNHPVRSETEINDQTSDDIQEKPHKLEEDLDKDERVGFFDFTLEDAFRAIQKPNTQDPAYRSDPNRTQSESSQDELPTVYSQNENRNQQSGNIVFTDEDKYKESYDEQNYTSGNRSIVDKLKDIVRP